MSTRKLTKNKKAREFEMLKRRYGTKKTSVLINSNHSYTNMLEHTLEKQKSRSKSMNSKVIYNIDINMLKYENKLRNRCNGSKNTSEYTLQNTIDSGKMKYHFKLKRNNIESKHTTSLISRNNVDNITDNRTESKIKRKNRSNYKPNTNAVTHKIVQLQRNVSHRICSFLQIRIY